MRLRKIDKTHCCECGFWRLCWEISAGTLSKQCWVEGCTRDVLGVMLLQDVDADISAPLLLAPLCARHIQQKGHLVINDGQSCVAVMKNQILVNPAT